MSLCLRLLKPLPDFATYFPLFILQQIPVHPLTFGSNIAHYYEIFLYNIRLSFPPASIALCIVLTHNCPYFTEITCLHMFHHFQS